MAIQKQFEIAIEKIVAGGDGLGRHEGRVVFVPGAAPGERIALELVENRRDYLRGRIVKILEASGDRREPPCVFYGECGGCSIMHLQPKAQAETKRSILLESLRRGGGLEFSGEIPIRTGPESGYRARSRFHVKVTRQGALVGFKQRRSHRLVDVTRCLQITPVANEVLDAFRRWLASRRDRATGLVSAEILESSAPSGRVLLHFLVNRGWALSLADLEELVGSADLAGLVVTEEPRGSARRRGRRLGSSSVVNQVAGLDYQVAVESFFQSNRFLLEPLVGEVVSDTEGAFGAVVELYCGVGLFTLPLARVAERVVGVESSSQAVEDARANARRAGLANVSFVCETAGQYVVQQGFEGVDLVVVDPPRGGLERQVVAGLSRQPPQELRYISCDPAALGRDAGKLGRAGLELHSLVLLDMFPNTHHFETVATFRLTKNFPA